MKKYILYSILLIVGMSGMSVLYYGLYGVPGFLSNSNKKKIVKIVKPEAKRRYTVLLPLSIKTIKFKVSKVHNNTVGSSGITKIGNHALILYGNRFYFFDLKKEKFTKLNMETPPNRRKVADRVVRKKIRRLRYTDVLAVQDSVKITLLISFIHFDEEKTCVSSRVARVDFPIEQSPLTWKVRAQDWRIVFKNPCFDKGRLGKYDYTMFGGAMVLSEKSDHIFLSIGYGAAGIDPPNLAYGRIVKININSGAAKTISVGHRNPQGMVFMPTKNGKQGQLWAVEHGPTGGDELNLIQQGKHYGWPFTTFGRARQSYHSKDGEILGHGQHKNYQTPVFVFVPSVGTSDITLIENFAPPWDGDFLISSFSGRLYRIRVVDNHAIYAEPIRLSYRIRNIHNQGNGVLLALRDSRSTRKEHHRLILTIIRAPQLLEDIKIVAPPEVIKITKAVWENCVSCHYLDLNTWRAPSLYHIMGRKVGQNKWNRGYSAAMKSSDLVWDRALLTAFLKDPNAVFEGTRMPPTGIQDPRVIKAIVDHLEKIK